MYKVCHISGEAYMHVYIYMDVRFTEYVHVWWEDRAEGKPDGSTTPLSLCVCVLNKELGVLMLKTTASLLGACCEDVDIYVFSFSLFSFSIYQASPVEC